MAVVGTNSTVEANLIHGMGENAYFKEYESAVKRFPASDVISRLQDLWKQKVRWEEISQSSPKVLNFIERNDLNALYHLIPEEHCNSFVNFSLGDRLERLRTLLRISELIKSPSSLIHEKKWQGPLLKTLGFYIDKSEERLLVYVKTRRIYKRKDRKTVYIIKELVSNNLFAATFTPENNKSKHELFLPGIIDSKSCPALVPCFKKIYSVASLKGGTKLLAIGNLFSNSCATMKFSYYTHTKMMLAAMVGADYLHDKGYAHHDIKPANIFCSFQGTFHLGDFGGTVPLGSKMRGGTRWYSSPEVSTTGEVTPQNSVWEIGIMGIMHITKLRLSDQFLDLKEKGLLNQDDVDKYLELILSSTKFENLKLIQFYTSCLRVNPNERPLLKDLIKTYQGFLKP